MRILVIEDDENKRNQLIHFLNRTFQGAEILEQRSLQSGLRRIRKDPPSIVLLDMTLPNYDAGPDEPGGQTHIFGGREFLRQMERFEIRVPVIVVTQFETFGKDDQSMGLNELNRQLAEEHPLVYRGSVYYHAAIHGWEDELKALIEIVAKEQT
jgi:CheY-like chemotaxis protein